MSSPAVFTQPPNKSLPPRLRAGDQHAWTVRTDLPPGTLLFYVLTGVIANLPRRHLIGLSGTPTTAGVAVGATGEAAFAITSAESGAWAAGLYQWVLFSLDANSNRSEVAEGLIRIDPDPNGVTPVDPRSYNQKLLANIRATLAGKSLDDVGMYKLGNRELTKVPIKELLYWEAIVEARVRKERMRRGEYVRTSTTGITFGGR